MMKRILTACAAVIFAAACSAPALEEIQRPEEQEKPVVSEKATIPFSLTVTTESTRVSYADGTYQFKAGDKIHVQGVERTDLEGYLTQNGNVWSGNLSYDGEQPATNTPLAITLVHADNTDVSTYAKAIVGSAPEGSNLLREAVEHYSLFTADNVTLESNSAVLHQQAAFLEVFFTFDFDGSHEVEAGQALVDLEIDGEILSTQTQFYPIDPKPEDFQVHFMAVVPGGKSVHDFTLMVGDREVEFKNNATLEHNKKYTVNRTVVYGPQLGDPFWSDGTYGRLNHADPNAQIVGIVVYVNHHYADQEKARIENAITEWDKANNRYGHGLVMALKNVTVTVEGAEQKYFPWSGDNGRQKCTAGYIETPAQTLDSPYFSGFENTNNIVAKLGEGNDSVASLAKNYGVLVDKNKCTGWFLPSIGQWMHSISIDGFGNANHPNEWFNASGNNWIQNGNTSGDLVFVKKCEKEDVNLLVRALNERLAKLHEDFKQYNFDYDEFGDPSAEVNVSDNYWTSTEKSDKLAIRMNLGTVNRYGSNYYSTIKAKGEDKTKDTFYTDAQGVKYYMKIRPFLAF